MFGYHVANFTPLGALLNSLPAGWAFKLPDTGVIDVPVNTTDNWVTTRSGGSPATALSVVDITDENAIAKIGSNKALRLVTGVTGHTNCGVRYNFPIEVKPINFNNYNICLWIRFVNGEGISAWNKSTELALQLRESFAAAAGGTIAIVNTEYAGAGWYAFSCAPYAAWNAAVNFENINELIIYVAKVATDNPIIEIGRIAIVPKHAKAQFTIQCDGGYSSHKTLADYLTTKGFKATFYVNGDGLQALSAADLLAMQADGHLIANYCRGWGSASDLAGRIALINVGKTYLDANGLTGGRHIVHGLTSLMTEGLWEGLVPAHIDTVAYARRQPASQYHKTYMPRYHELEAANKTAIITEINRAIEKGGRIGLLCHDLTTARLDTIVDIIDNTLVPAVAANQIDVVTVKQAFDSI